MRNTINESFFYHIYPLGMCNCSKQNDFCQPAGNAFENLIPTLDKIAGMGINALYIGPIFESSKHGYDTVDYYYVDRRLGNNQKFADFCRECHKRGIKVVLDAVFNHTGRDFFAFKDIQQNGENSIYKNWYVGLNFNQKSCCGDNFDYNGWSGCMDLVKLDTDNVDVQNHIFGAVNSWIDLFDIDGLRLDAADVLSKGFMDNLQSFCQNKKPGFWLMGEVVHGNYNDWAREGRLDSVTNYQLYKGMWSSFNEGNFFEVAYSLKEEFGEGEQGKFGKYKNLYLYNFLDNHDVNRIASTVKDQRYLYPLYGMLFTVPGIPSIYYGSEEGVKGSRTDNSDYQLRPSLPPFSALPDYATPELNSDDLRNTISKIWNIRKNEDALKRGQYRQLYVSSKQFAFERFFENQQIIVVFNSDFVSAKIDAGKLGNGIYSDLLNGGEFNLSEKMEIPSCWLRILKRK